MGSNSNAAAAGGSGSGGEQEERKNNAQRMKDVGRESRLSFRNFAEHQMRRELKERSMEVCKARVSEFAECAEDKGLFVVFSCRKQHKAVQQCLSENNSEEAFRRFKIEHQQEWELRSKGLKPK